MTGGDLDRRGKGEVAKNASGRGMILIERVRNHNIRHRSRTLWITNPTQIHLQHNLWNLNVLPTPERSCSAAEKLVSRLVSDHDSVGLRHQTRRLLAISLRVELHEPGNRGDSATQEVVNAARRHPLDKLILNGPKKLFVFGDSYADTGNWPPTNASGSWREPYAAYLGMGSPQPYNLWKGDGEANQYGMNFAYGGTGVFHYTNRIKEFADSVTKQLSFNLRRIHEMGIHKVAVTAMQPLGCLPLVAFSTGNYSNCDESTNSFTRFHNQMLKQRVEELNDQTEGSPFGIVDLYAAFTSALNIKHDQHPGKSSFPRRLQPCCEGKCGVVDESGKKENTVCDDPKMAFFWDMAHPSQQGWFAVYSALKPSLPHLFHCQQATPIV
nr:GDSL esterase/lipase At5g03610-like [Ipomoea batatas]